MALGAEINFFTASIAAYTDIKRQTQYDILSTVSENTSGIDIGAAVGALASVLFAHHQFTARCLIISEPLDY